MMPMGSDLDDSDKSKVRRIDRPRQDAIAVCQCASVEASVLPETQARQTACPSAPSLSDALADCVQCAATGTQRHQVGLGSASWARLLTNPQG